MRLKTLNRLFFNIAKDLYR